MKNNLLILFVLNFYCISARGQIINYEDDKINWQIEICRTIADSFQIQARLRNVSADTLLISETASNYVSRLSDSIAHVHIGWDRYYPDGNLKMKKLQPNEEISFKKRLFLMNLSKIFISVSYIPNIPNNSNFYKGIMLGYAHLIEGKWYELELNFNKNLKTFTPPLCNDD